MGEGKLDFNSYHQCDYGKRINDWISRIKLSKTRIIMFISISFIIPLFFIHYYLSKVETSSLGMGIPSTHSKFDVFEDFTSMKAADLKLRINEMLRIKLSVSNELRDLEAKRHHLQMEVTGFTQKIIDIKQELLHQQTDLDRLKMSVLQAQAAQREAVEKNTPELAPPKRILINKLPEILTINDSSSCKMYNCFDHSRCSLTSGFPVYFYDPDLISILHETWDIDGFLRTTIKQTLGYNPHLTSNPAEACIYIVLIGEVLLANPIESTLESPIINKKLHSLPYWGGDGRNHILLNLARRDLSAESGNIFNNVDTGRAIIVQSTFQRNKYRENFDLILPPILGPPGGDIWQECGQIVPARRKYLLSFQGEIKNKKKKTLNKITTESDINFEKITIDENNLDNFIVQHLKEMTTGTTMDKFFVQFECIPASENYQMTEAFDWSLCGTDSSRKEILKQSTFALILAPTNTSYITTSSLQARLYESLRSGAIPVVLGGDQIFLSYNEVISWKRAAIFLPKARVTEMHFLLRAIPDNDLLSMKRQGRLIWERYMGTVQSAVDTIIAVIRNRIGIPPLPAIQSSSPSVFNETFIPLKPDNIIPEPETPEESLGPSEPPYPSPSFKRNYTFLLIHENEIWNDWVDPFNLYPQLPFDPVLPSDAKFIGSEVGFRPIGKGAGGAGKEFSESLGGNHPREQFTIVMLTYEREQILVNSLARLYGLPYLNKVIVVWNSLKPPMEDLRWPEIGVPIVVIKATKNSLNNRFLPFDSIETEAVLSVDDDAHLRHDEIMFGFRVWREHRDRVVGFPGRFHAWDQNYHNSWNYNSNYSCELSMVLTGAAFIHKHYTYLYTHWLPQAIRDKVDEYMNCEDIAMNFLISHLTRKPPVKVTSRWTFRCPGCPVSLSEDDTHFQERHRCINFFSQVFGYMPLLNTQYRADSILFKTRIPHDKQKCFKFI